ncbi:DNA repair exonuclease [Breoghania sp. L-A4]|uniref:metallophosphoesterase family protein n=1 Tax=Breoghania sp. L-A4 TaxID=2304600 RepID=UPI000E35B02D|nr:DNA repair exonuclease [Breoghania sp. L-A4]AXS41005.1 DNA repair exonuclease [Breoghania sp. L-A4]
MFRFVHTADIHLDSPLLSLALKEPEAAQLVANATRQSFSRIIQLCLDEDVDALLIAGDLYDGTLRSMKTAAFVTSELRRLTGAGIKVFLIRGNHDAESRITRHLELPEGVHLFSGRAQAVALADGDVVIHGMSFAKPAAPDSLLPHYAPPAAGAINIGLLHTSLSGAEGHDPYAPCSVAELLGQGYDYWALGHIHKRAVHAGPPNAIVMPGIPQGRHVNESGPKSVTVVEIGDDHAMRIEERFVALVQFERVTVDVSGADDMSALIGLSEAALSAALEAARSEHLIARVELRGETPLAPQLRRDADVLLEEIREAGRRCGQVLVEEVVTGVVMPRLETKSALSDPVSELRLLMLGEGLDRTAARGAAMDLMLELQKKLPPELRDAFGVDDADRARLVEGYLDEGAEDVLARLDAGEADR